jgi:hypothetical protein
MIGSLYGRPFVVFIFSSVGHGQCDVFINVNNSIRFDDNSRLTAGSLL